MSERIIAGPLGNDPVNAAVQEGKIPPARAEHYRRLMKADPKGTREVLAALAPVLPLGEVGVAVLPDEQHISGGAAPDDDAYPESWLSPADLKNRHSPAKGPGSITTEQGG
jgi:hypothetical protein